MTTHDHAHGRPVVPARGRLRPLGLDEVRITGGFWGERQRVNAAATIRHCLKWMDKLGWTGNFTAAAEGRLPRDRAGREFSDSEVYKLMEAMAWEIARSGDEELEAEFARLTETVAAAQEEDGYLNTMFGRPGQGPRYSDLEWGHELYCYGHLLQAAVARLRTHGEDDFVRVARRVADHVCETFGPEGNPGVCGHAEIELALAEFARATGESRYLEQAKLFIDRRGHGRLSDPEFGRSYYQDDLPIREADVLRGHAVRALYLASGAVDVAMDTGDEALLAAVLRQWEATLSRRVYLTGGMGSQHKDEAFGPDYALPPDRAYSETCAGVAAVQLCWRLLLATGDPRHAETLERVLYNVLAGAVAPDGQSFFYANTLHQRTPGTAPSHSEPSPHGASSIRAPWFTVSCCPTNISRTFAGLGAYLATVDDEGVQIHQYTDSTINTALDDGRRVGIEVRTTYPEHGAVSVRITETDGSRWALRLRVPAWAGDRAIVVGPSGRRFTASRSVTITHAFRPGDEVRLELPVRPRWTEPHPDVDAVRGCLAVEQGPIVLCAESVDLPDGRDVRGLRVDPTVAPTVREGRVVIGARLVTEPARAWPYRERREPPRPEPAEHIVEVPLIPYHARANRGPSTMRVWLPYQ